MRVASLAAAVCGALLLTSVASLSWADDATMDAVHLRNGGLYRGRVTEIVPGDHVSITVATSGESKRIAWAEVDRVIVAQTPVPPPPTATGAGAAPAASPPPPPPPMAGPRTRVHITSPKQAILYRKAAGTSSFVQACTSPCDEELPVNDTYRLAGNGFSQNKEFHLSGSGGGTTEIVVDPPSIGGMVLGGLIAGTGATAAYVGLLLALVGQEKADSSCYGTYCSSDNSDGQTMRNAGLVTMLVGAAVTALGVVVFINSASTDVSMKGSSGASADAYVRRPTWQTPSTPSNASFPLLFTTHF